MHVIGRLAGKKATQVVGWMDGRMNKHPSIYQAPSGWWIVISLLAEVGVGDNIPIAAKF
jgi:hypothetical protein